jgi:RIO kinase 1
VVRQPYNFHDGVLLMEPVTNADRDAAPRLNDMAFTQASHGNCVLNGRTNS